MGDDRDLLTGWRAGDKNAGKALFAKYGPMMTAYFRRKLYDTSEVSALVNDTFFACVSTRRAFEGPPEAVRPYLFGIAHNKLREHIRRRATATKWIDPSADAVEVGEVSLHDIDPRDPSDFAEQAEDRKLLLKAVRRIPIDFQLVFELSFWEGLSNREIAEVLDIPVGTVAGRLRLGRERIEKELRALEQSPALLQTTTMSLQDWIERIQAYKDEMRRSK
jgi:RNA polymerase sigma-70 factor (ECF subfamily)